MQSINYIREISTKKKKGKLKKKKLPKFKMQNTNYIRKIPTNKNLPNFRMQNINYICEISKKKKGNLKKNKS